MKQICLFVLGMFFIGLAGCTSSADQAELKKYRDERASTETRLARFDSLDFEVFSKEKWDLLNVSHADDIVVNWPDGHQTKGIAKHIEDLKTMFVFAPDTRVEAHPIRFGSGEWTAVTGVFAGTFSKPMPIGNGRTIAPTNKAFRLNMATIGHWNGKTMDHEWLFWDNQDFMKQIGLAH